MPWCSVSQRRRIILQVFHQHERHRDVRRQRHVAVDDDIPLVVRHRGQVLPVRRTELYDDLRLVDLRRVPGKRGATMHSFEEVLHTCNVKSVNSTMHSK